MLADVANHSKSVGWIDIENVLHPFTEVMQPHVPHFVALLYYLYVVECFAYFLQLPAQIPLILCQPRSIEPHTIPLVRALTAQITLLESDEILLLVILLDLVYQPLYLYFHLLDSPRCLLLQQVLQRQLSYQFIHL